MYKKLKFQLGDRMVNIGCQCHPGVISYPSGNKGKHGKVRGVDYAEIEMGSGRGYHILYDDGGEGTGWACCYELENNKTIMQKVSIMMKKLVSSDIQTLVKAGYLSDELEITSKGQEALLAELFEQNKAALVTAAQADLDTAKDE